MPYNKTRYEVQMSNNIITECLITNIWTPYSALLLDNAPKGKIYLGCVGQVVAQSVNFSGSSRRLHSTKVWIGTLRGRLVSM